MGRITRLAPDLANQIAAGEVVERPASVVKELVENAIDAGARRIAIHIELGGKKQVRVEDDGEGDGAGRCAAGDRASRDEQDPARGRSGGDSDARVPRRGAAVDRLGLAFRAADAVARAATRGTEIRVNGGFVASAAEVAAAEGTVIEVNDLFYNLPARRKFLKSDAAESAQVSRVTTQLALALSGGRLHADERRPRASSSVRRWRMLRDRLYQLYGDRDDLLQVHKEAGGIRLNGYIASLAEQGPTRGPQNVFINRRIVKDRTIAHAIITAYSVASIKERSPEVHLFIEMPPDAVDVNVHPTKAEVRFRDQSFVHEVVRRALMDALGAGGVPQLQLRPESVAGAPADGCVAAGCARRRDVPEPVGAGRRQRRSGSRPGGLAIAREPATAAAATRLGPAEARLGPTGGPVWRRARWPTASEIRPMIPLGQFRDTFIIAIDDEGIAIIDQHVAHERVLFERVMQTADDGTARIAAAAGADGDRPACGRAQALVSRATELERLGYEVEPFGDSTIKVSAVPALLTTEGQLRRRCWRSARISKGSIAALTCRRRCSASRRSRPVMRR